MEPTYIFEPPETNESLPIPKTGFAFSSLVDIKRIAFDTSAPNFRQVYQGMHLIGICQSNSCVAWNKRVIIPKKLGSFSIAAEQDKTSCPACKTAIAYANIINLGFFDCTITLDGTRDGKTVKKELVADNTKFTTFDETRPTLWQHLTVTTQSRSWGWPRCSIL